MMASGVSLYTGCDSCYTSDGFDLSFTGPYPFATVLYPGTTIIGTDTGYNSFLGICVGSPIYTNNVTYFGEVECFDGIVSMFWYAPTAPGGGGVIFYGKASVSDALSTGIPNSLPSSFYPCSTYYIPGLGNVHTFGTGGVITLS
jgi:hypothetical protein